MALFLGNTLVTPIMIGDNYTWKGRNVETVANNFYTFNTTLDQTGFATWTASTTASVILASQAATPTFSADLTNYDYIIEWLYDINIAPTTIVKGLPVRTCGCAYNILVRDAHNIVSTNSPTWTANYNTSTNLAYYFCEYMSSATAKAIRRNLGYGFYGAAVSPTFSSTAAAEPTITLNTPSVSTRCHNTYFPTGTYGNINQSASTIKMQANIYRVDAFTSPISNIISNVRELYANPL